MSRSFLRAAVAAASALTAILVLDPSVVLAGGPPELSGLDALYPSLDALYQDLHRNPELSNHEEKTAAKMAARLRQLGFEVTEHEQAAEKLADVPAERMEVLRPQGCIARNNGTDTLYRGSAWVAYNTWTWGTVPIHAANGPNSAYSLLVVSVFKGSNNQLRTEHAELERLRRQTH